MSAFSRFVAWLSSWLTQPFNPEQSRELRRVLRENRLLRRQLRRDGLLEQADEELRKARRGEGEV